MSENNSTLQSGTPRVSRPNEMKDFSKENSSDENGVSLYIPFVFTYVTRQMVVQKLEEHY